MSRTFRRKNYEAENNTSWDVRGRKTAGFYTHRLGHWNGYTHWYTYEIPTNTQHHREYWRNHGESKSANSWSPGHSYRNMRMRENRAMARQELHKYKALPDYEPIIEANPRNCWWDWS